MHIFYFIITFQFLVSRTLLITVLCTEGLSWVNIRIRISIIIIIIENDTQGIYFFRLGVAAWPG